MNGVLGFPFKSVTKKHKPTEWWVDKKVNGLRHHSDSSSQWNTVVCLSLPSLDLLIFVYFVFWIIFLSPPSHPWLRGHIKNITQKICSTNLISAKNYKKKNTHEAQNADLMSSKHYWMPDASCLFPTEHFTIKCTEFQIAFCNFDANSRNLNAVKVLHKNFNCVFLV